MSKHPNAKHTRGHVDDLRAAAKLVVGATTGVTGVVEDMHRTIASGPVVLGQPLSRPARVVTALAYGHVRNVTRLVGSVVNLSLAQLAPFLGSSVPGTQRDAVQSALNGVLGDYLQTSGNPLAIDMALRSEGRALPLDAAGVRGSLPLATSKLVLLVHGSSLSDRQWTRLGHDHGAALARDLGYTPVYLRYNSGLHISSNGRELAALLEQLVGSWPVPLEEIAILGHSMGGLVARSACHAAEVEGRAWRQLVRKIVCLGSPHHGSPLERSGNWLDALLEISRYSTPLARLGRIRSAGVTDLRFGNVLDAHWHGRERFAHEMDERCPLPLPTGVDCYAIAASTALEMAVKLPGDGLVPVDSALGRHANGESTVAFPEAHQWIAFGAKHLDLLSRKDVYDQIRTWLASGSPVDLQKKKEAPIEKAG